LLSSAGLHLSVFVQKSDRVRRNKENKAILKEAHDKVRDLSHELFHHYCHVSDFYALNDLCENSNSHIHFEYSSAIDEKHATIVNLK
jgi:hypothetical protein